MDEENEVEQQVEGEVAPKPSFKLFKGSPKLLARCDPAKMNASLTTREMSKGQAKYPFAEMFVGESFTVSFAESTPLTLANLRSAASIASKRLERKFAVIIHNDYQCFEVGRIA